MSKRPDVLNQLITLAGTQKQLAKLLGVDAHSIHDWLRAGKISKRGALLVESSVAFNYRCFKAHRIRPDIDPKLWVEAMLGSMYAASRRKQIDYERSPEFTRETPIALLQELERQKANK